MKGCRYMNLNLNKTLKSIERDLAQENALNIKVLRRAYRNVLHLRAQLIGVISDIEHYTQLKIQKPKPQPPQSIHNNAADKRLVTLSINEPLPSLKELTESVELHWVDMIHKAIAKESLTGIPRFDKAFVIIEITTPKGTNNQKVWDTSNRAINVIINNLKGIFFEDDNFEHMACAVVADWGEIGNTNIHICELSDGLGWFSFNPETVKSMDFPKSS